MVVSQVHCVLREPSDKCGTSILRFRNRDHRRQVVLGQILADRVRNHVAALLVTGRVGLGEVVRIREGNTVIAHHSNVCTYLKRVPPFNPGHVIQNVVDRRAAGRRKNLRIVGQVVKDKAETVKIPVMVPERAE